MELMIAGPKSGAFDFRVPGLRSKGLRIPGSQVPGSQVSGLRVSDLKVPGLRVLGLRVPGLGSQVLILDCAMLDWYHIHQLQCKTQVYVL